MVEAAYIFPKQTALFKHSKKTAQVALTPEGVFFSSAETENLSHHPMSSRRYTHNGSLLTDARNNSDSAAATTAEIEQQWT